LPVKYRNIDRLPDADHTEKHVGLADRYVETKKWQADREIRYKVMPFGRQKGTKKGQKDAQRRTEKRGQK
jgi:hypothetical protein